MTIQPYAWSESKRAANLAKHGLDFENVVCVLESRYRLDVLSERNGEARIQSFAYVVEYLAVLTVVHLEKQRIQIISFRRASAEERETYHEWLEKDFRESDS